MPTITNLATIKGKLGISTTSRDAAITSVWNGAEAWVIDRTGFALASGSRTDVLRDVQLDRPFLLTRRPVSALTLAEGRVPGGDGASWAELTADLLDADKGEVIVLGAPGFQVWPPTQPEAEWFRWRDPIWPLVRVSYTTGAATVPNDLVDATAALAAYWYQRHLAGVTSATRIVETSESYLSYGIPPWVSVVVERYVRSAAGTAGGWV